MSNLLDTSIANIHKSLKNGDVSALDLVNESKKRIDQYQSLNAFVYTDYDAVTAKAKEYSVQDNKSVLGGIPAGLKDLFSIQGMHTEACSNILKGYKPPYTATVAKKLLDSGALIMGKTNMDEFACGASNEYSSYGPVSNPWNTEKVAGGSSGGSAVAVASGQVPYALGTDTGGSVRQPASFCGVTGLKPTYGRISRFGVLAMSSSLDTVGIFARTAEDVACVLQEIAGYDRFDATTAKREVPTYTQHESKLLSEMTFGVPREFFVEGLDSEVEKVIRENIEVLRKEGATIKEVTLPHSPYAVAVYYIIVPSELSANLARYDGIRFGAGLENDRDSADLIDYYCKVRDQGFGDEIKRRIMIGTYCLSAGYVEAYFKKALKVRTKIVEDFNKVFSEVDALIGPVAPSVAFNKNELKNDPLQMYLADMYTIPASVAGLCSLSVPCGFAHDLPVGMQIIGPQFQEEHILSIAKSYQSITDWHSKRPPLS